MDHAALIVERIESVRRERGISVAELARRASIDKKRLWYILHGERALRSYELVRLSVVLNLGMQHYLTRDQAKELCVHRQQIRQEYGDVAAIAALLRRNDP